MLPWTVVLSRLKRVSAKSAVVAAVAVSALACGIAPERVDSNGKGREDAHDPVASEPQPTHAGSDRIGIPAPPFTVANWIGTPVASLQGRVALVRFFTDGCPYCRATAPALAALDRDFRARGLVVVGIFHPKPRGSRRAVEDVARVVESWGWTFSVGLDDDWATVDAWWLDSGEREATSASFLVDASGVIRWVHPGPEFHPAGPADHEQCRRDYAELRAAIEALLPE